MKRFLLGSGILLALTSSGCPLYSDSNDGCSVDDQCPVGQFCAPGGYCDTYVASIPNGCTTPSSCVGNTTCGADGQCHPGDCSYPSTGCYRGYQCERVENAFQCVMTGSAPDAGDAGVELPSDGSTDASESASPMVDAAISFSVSCGAEKCDLASSRCCFEIEGEHAATCEKAACGVGRSSTSCDGPSDCPTQVCCATAQPVADASLSAWTARCQTSCVTVVDGGDAATTGLEPHELCTGGPTLNTCSAVGKKCVNAPAFPTGYKWCTD